MRTLKQIIVTMGIRIQTNQKKEKQTQETKIVGKKNWPNILSVLVLVS